MAKRAVQFAQVVQPVTDILRPVYPVTSPGTTVEHQIFSDALLLTDTTTDGSWRTMKSYTLKANDVSFPNSIIERITVSFFAAYSVAASAKFRVLVNGIQTHNLEPFAYVTATESAMKQLRIEVKINPNTTNFLELQSTSIDAAGQLLVNEVTLTAIVRQY